jgi:hypothetical protein
LNAEPPPLLLFDEASGEFDDGVPLERVPGTLVKSLTGGIDAGEGWIQLPPPVLLRTNAPRPV